MAKKVSEQKQFYDIIGAKILPGSLIAFSRTGQGTKSLKCHIVSSIVNNRIYIIGRRWMRNPQTGSYEFVTSAKSSYTEANTHLEHQDHIVVLNDPLFYMDSPKIKSAIEISLAAIESGIFPKDYKLGVGIEPSE